MLNKVDLPQPDGPMIDTNSPGAIENDTSSTAVITPSLVMKRLLTRSTSSRGASRASAVSIEAAGAELRYLPPYSPDLNPIELAFSKLKKLLRDGAARTVDKLWELCGRILDQFTEAECRNYFQHCGYRHT